MGISGVLAVAGNILVITAIITNKKLRTPRNLGLFSLAWSDSLVGLVSVPVMIYIYIQGLTSYLCQFSFYLDLRLLDKFVDYALDLTHC